MLYLLGKIFIWLLLAAGLGFIIGWYLRKFFMRDSKNTNHISMLQDENKKLKSDLNLCLETAKDLKKKTSSSTDIVKDNLQNIRGIGKTLEIRLNQLGIYTLQQIAEWDNTDIENIKKNIGPFRDRIKRDKWVIQAKELNKLKNIT